jgi:hypothetical protein
MQAVRRFLSPKIRKPFALLSTFDSGSDALALEPSASAPVSRFLPESFVKQNHPR